MPVTTKLKYQQQGVNSAVLYIYQLKVETLWGWIHYTALEKAEVFTLALDKPSALLCK